MWKYDKSLNKTDWTRVTFLDRVYKLHCDGRNRVRAHGMANLHSCDGTINAESYIWSLLTNTTRDSRLLSKSNIKP